jgi:CDP-diacylglycerol pyrophosphatase
MASSNFDELTKALATSISRRQTIKVLFASVLGGGLGFGGIGTVQAVNCSGSDPCSMIPSNCGKDNDETFLWERVKCCVDGCTNSLCKKLYPNGPPCYHCTAMSTQWVVMGKIVGSTQHPLFLPTKRIKGIECSYLWNGAPDYWTPAWEEATKLLKSDSGSSIGLAVNSACARDQCQLHIHMSCIRKDVLTTLNNAPSSKIALKPENWRKYGPLQQLGLKKKDYYVLLQSSIPKDLFTLLKNVPAVGDKNMQNQTLVVTKGSKGFYILNSADPGVTNGEGHGENLLDDSVCSNK